MRILCPSNQLGCSISLHLIVDLAKTYENEWSQCSNDQIIKNLWLLEVRKLLMHCDAAQYSKAFDSVGCVDLEKFYEINKNVTQTDDWAKSYDISKFPNFLRFLGLSNQLGRSFSLYLLIDLAKT